MSAPIKTRFVESGEAAQSGDIFYVTHEPDKCWARWSNCDGKHLHVMLPFGHVWDVDGRAGNCDKQAEHTHRCWARRGPLEALTVDKSGNTCDVGQGSIVVGNWPQAGSWHGFLTDGYLVERP